jgi:steroid 5-alpha reductase family enzyme
MTVPDSLNAAAAGLVVLLAASTLVWAASVRRHDASIADIAWGPGFALVGWLYCIRLDGVEWRRLLLAALITAWGLRLAVHIHRRHRGKGEDPRYGAMRRGHGDAFWWRSLIIVFWLQAALVWFVSLPIFAVARSAGPPGLTVADVAGLLLFMVGFAFESVADLQLERFKARPSNRGRVLDTGLWRYSRHPNYFGDALLWWGVYVIATSVPGGWLTVASPLVMTALLLRVSGVSLLEPSLKASKPGYQDYIERTPAFVPWFPRPKKPSGGTAPT